MTKTKARAVTKTAATTARPTNAMTIQQHASSSNNPPKKKTKDYAYRSTWKHKLSRAKNLAKRGGMTKQEMMTKYGRFPKKNEWWGPEENEKEWLAKWTLANPQC